MSEPVSVNMPPVAYVSQLISDLEFTTAILVAVKLGIADLLKDGPRTIIDLAKATGSHSRSLYRMMRALASRGMFSEGADRRFSLTSLASPLLADAPDSVRTWALWIGSEVNLRTWADLSYSVRTGQPAFEHMYGKALFDYLGEQPEMAKIYNNLMTSGVSGDGAAIANGHDFSSYRKIVDIGGGHGAQLAYILERYTGLYGVLFDAPPVIAGVKGAIVEYIAQGRAEKVAGNFFEAVPNGGDVYMLRQVIHDWDDEQAAAILRNCRRAMAENGKILIVEEVIPPGNEPSSGKFTDLNMLLYVGGLERTETEYRDLLQQAGLVLARTITTASSFSIMEAVPS